MAPESTSESESNMPQPNTRGAKTASPVSTLAEELQLLVDRFASFLEPELRVVQQHLGLATLGDASLVSMHLSAFLFREINKGNRILALGYSLS
jgi:hypothetical protein